MSSGFAVATGDEAVDGGGEEGGGTVSVDVHLHEYVAYLYVFVVFVFGVDVNDLHHDGGGVADFVGGERVALYADADDDVGTHLTCKVGGVVVAEAAVDEHHVADADGGEYARDGH